MLYQIQDENQIYILVYPVNGILEEYSFIKITQKDFVGGSHKFIVDIAKIVSIISQYLPLFLPAFPTMTTSAKEVQTVDTAV